MCLPVMLLQRHEPDEFLLHVKTLTGKYIDLVCRSVMTNLDCEKVTQVCFPGRSKFQGGCSCFRPPNSPPSMMQHFWVLGCIAIQIVQQFLGSILVCPADMSVWLMVLSVESQVSSRRPISTTIVSMNERVS